LEKGSIDHMAHVKVVQNKKEEEIYTSCNVSIYIGNKETKKR